MSEFDDLESTCDGHGYYWPKKPLTPLLHGITAEDVETLLRKVADAAHWRRQTRVEGYHAMLYSARLAGNLRLGAMVCPDPSFGHARLSGDDWKLTVQLYTYSPLTANTEKMVVPTKTGLVQFNAYQPLIQNRSAFKRDMALLRMFDVIP